MKNSAFAALFLAGVTCAFAAEPKKSDRPAAKSCASCREKHPLVDPASLGKDDEKARPAYAAAQKHPETLDAIHCYCGCEQNPNLKHVSLLTCFTSAHATGCEICQKEAVTAGQMKDEGSSDEETKTVVESLYKTR